MHASGKIFMGIGLVLVLIGGGIFVMGAMSASDAIDNIEENYWALEEVTSGTIEIVDDDGEGEIGFSMFIEGTLEDANEDDVWDHCEPYDYETNPPTDFTVTHTDDSDNSFWYACDTDWDDDTALNDMTRMEGDKNLVKIGDAAFRYENGTATVSCATVCWVQYDDKAWDEAGEDALDAAGGFFAAFCGGPLFFGAGCCFFIIGLILGLTVKDQQQAILVQGGGGGQMVGTPVVAAGGAVPMMGAPMAVPVAAAPVAAPDPAQEYYSGLLSQGYDADSAVQYTAQHFPGFQG